MTGNKISIQGYPKGLKIIAIWIFLEAFIGSFQLYYWYREERIFSSDYNLQTTYVTFAIIFTAFSIAYFITSNKRKFIISALLLSLVHLFVCVHYGLYQIYNIVYIESSELRRVYIDHLLGEPSFYFSYIYVLSMIFVSKYLIKSKELLSN